MASTNLDRSLNKIEDGVVTIGIFLTVVITFGNVVARYLFRAGSGWPEESVRYLMIWISFIGMGIGIRTQSHIVVDFFVEKVFGHHNPKRTRVNRMGYSVACFFSLFLFVSSLVLTLKVFEQGQISAGLEIPMWIAYAMLPVATFLSTLRYLLIAVRGGGEERKYWD
jgi:C4-dicarboxylate transporter DctQ subunit